MILIDANILIYAHNLAADQHAAAKRWLEDTLSSDQAVRLSWAGIHAFLRLTTQRTFVAQPLAMSDAAAIVEDWIHQDNVGLLQPGARYWNIFRRLLSEAQIRGPMVMDAHLAALAIEHGATLCSTDKDFSRFEGLRVVNPLQKK